MLRKLVLFLLFLSTFEAFAQKEIYFTSSPTDSIKVQSMHGFEIESGINTSKLITPYDHNDKSFRIPLYMGYFKEKRIAPSWTLITRIGLNHNFGNLAHYKLVKDSMQMPDSMYHFTSQKIDHYKFEYQLTLGISIEPRWYVGYKKRSQNENVKLNSGWFLSLPLSVTTSLINTYKSDIYNGLLSYKTYCSFGLTGVIGYRQAISKQLFLEGNCQLINASSQLYGMNNTLYMGRIWITPLPSLTIKAAYTFN
jgi:hypothetical protein